MLVTFDLGEKPASPKRWGERILNFLILVFLFASLLLYLALFAITTIGIAGGILWIISRLLRLLGVHL